MISLTKCHDNLWLYMYVTGCRETFRMAENCNTHGNDSKVEPYQFEPVHVTGYSDSEGDNSKSETS